MSVEQKIQYPLIFEEIAKQDSLTPEASVRAILRLPALGARSPLVRAGDEFVVVRVSEKADGWISAAVMYTSKSLEHAQNYVSGVNKKAAESRRRQAYFLFTEAGKYLPPPRTVPVKDKV